MFVQNVLAQVSFCLKNLIWSHQKTVCCKTQRFISMFINTYINPYPKPVTSIQTTTTYFTEIHLNIVPHLCLNISRAYLSYRNVKFSWWWFMKIVFQDLTLWHHIIENSNVNFPSGLLNCLHLSCHNASYMSYAAQIWFNQYKVIFSCDLLHNLYLAQSNTLLKHFNLQNSQWVLKGFVWLTANREAMATGVHHINNPAAGDRNPVYTFCIIWPTGMEFIHWKEIHSWASEARSTTTFRCNS